MCTRRRPTRSRPALTGANANGICSLQSVIAASRTTQPAGSVDVARGEQALDARVVAVVSEATADKSEKYDRGWTTTTDGMTGVWLAVSMHRTTSSPYIIVHNAHVVGKRRRKLQSDYLQQTQSHAVRRFPVTACATRSD